MAYPEVVLGGVLTGSRASLDRQFAVARRNDFTLLESAADVRRFVARRLLVPVRDSRDLRVRGAAFPVARVEVRTFLQRLSSQYRGACGEPLVVTSLTRPASRQPANAHPRSVHRAGMAVDIRRSGRAACRRWLESTLRSLEARGEVEATHEQRPAHYHVAVFPRRHTDHVARLGEARRAPRNASRRAVTREYVVCPGDTLSTIARRRGTTIRSLRKVNALKGVDIFSGQKLRLSSGTRAVPLSRRLTLGFTRR